MVKRVPHRQSASDRTPHPASIPATLRRVLGILVGAIVGILTLLFFSGHLLIGGVPSSIVLEFLQDQPAWTAYWQGDRQALHDRLSELGVEEQIKAYYRPQIPDEVKLDQHIHQLLYLRTGYVGEAYRVTEQGLLVLKSSSEKNP
ncbi:MAG: hypothetical protein MUF49_02585 [Oculatellaceae cyanobacterium Prado106]|jgi:hypothetical protein|nr:hypothetical protein [Oculatellaceae cyanobacterium Prado106]